MNDAKLVLDKPESLVSLAKTADTEYEKAALYGATSIIINIIEKENSEFNLLLDESIGRVRWSTAALLGYDITNGHSNDQHFVWFIGSLNVIRDKLIK